jgi:type IV pilus assembly protein PilQ
MNRTSNLLILLVGVVCLSVAVGELHAADPVSETKKSSVSVPAAVKAPAPVAKSAPVPAVSSVATVSVPIVKGAPATGVASDTISLDFKDADISSVLRVLSMKSNVNIVTGPEVTGLVTVRLDDVPWEKALEVILRTYDYVYERDGNIIRVTTRDKMKLEPVETKTFILNYSKAAEIQASIMDMLSERGKVKASERTNMVVVTDVPTNLFRIGEIIKKLDKQTAQAFIDSKIVRTDLSNLENLGIDWNVAGGLTQGAVRPTSFPFMQGSGNSYRNFFPLVGADSGASTSTGTVVVDTAKVVANPGDNRGFPIPPAEVTGGQFAYGTLDFSSFRAMMQFLETRNDAKVVSNPRVVVLNNQTATIQVGKEIPVPSFERNEQTGSMEVTGFKYRDTGVVLNVTPHINSADEILVDLTPEVSDVGPNQSFGTGQIQAPTFVTTKAKTQVLIQSGQTIAIGGLLNDKFGSTENKVPYLGDVPLIGKLFRSKRQSAGENSKVETLFFVTVTTVDSQGQPAGDKVDGKNDQSKDDQTRPKTAAMDAARGLKGSEMKISSEKANKDTPV